MSPKISKHFLIRLYLVKLFDALCRLIKWRKLEKVIKGATMGCDRFCFVQIGANDGVIYDPIHHFVNQYNWSGVLVEPVSFYFNRLKQNYSENPRLNFENVAISDKNEIREFFRIKEDLDFLPAWCHGLGTFHLDVLLTHRWAIPNIAEYVITEQVNCIPFPALLEKHSITHIDLLLIDTEGHDYEIIRQVDFARLRPKIIVYEHQYISSNDRRQCEHALKEKGYILARHLGNTMAYLPKECSATDNS